MSKNFICGGSYVLGGPMGDSIGLPVECPGLPESIIVGDLALLKREDFHVTLVALGEIARKRTVAIPDFILQAVDTFCVYEQEHPISLVGYTGEFRFVSQGERRSVVAMCEVSNLRPFFDNLNGGFNLDAEYPPTHVTLYTLQPNQGIFLTDSNDLLNLTRPIEVEATIRETLLKTNTAI